MSQIVFLRRDNGTVEFSGTYVPGMVDAVKAELPRYGRGWNPDSRCWWVKHEYERKALEIAARHYDTVLVAVTVEEMERRVAAGKNGVGGASADERALCVGSGAPRVVVDAAYRALAKLLHPDVSGADTTARMQEINTAYERLKKRSGPW